MASANVYSPDYDNQGNPKRSIPELKDAIENAINNAVSNVEAAQNDAVSAVDSREQRALDNIDDAQLDVEAAKTAAEDAEKYAVETGPFTDSDGIDREQGAKGWALEAEAQRNLAETAATDAEDAANTATAEADAASGHADDAQQAATDAQNSADDALAASSFVGIVDTESDLSSISSPSAGDQALVRDDTANGNGTQAIYEYDGTSWGFTGHSLVSEGQRNSPSGFVGVDSDGFPELDEQTWYLDATGGSDSNHGKDHNAPIASLSEAASRISDGDTLLIRRGSVLRNEGAAAFSGLSHNRIAAYGEDGHLPVLRGDTIIDPANISQHGTYSNVYEVTVTLAQALQIPGQSFYDNPNPTGTGMGFDNPEFYERLPGRMSVGERMDREMIGGDLPGTLQTLDNNAGTWAVANTTDGDPTDGDQTLTYYWHPSDGGDPTSNGAAYSYNNSQDLIQQSTYIELEDLVLMRPLGPHVLDIDFGHAKNVHALQYPRHGMLIASMVMEECSVQGQAFSGFHGFISSSQATDRGNTLVDCLSRDTYRSVYSHDTGGAVSRPFTAIEGLEYRGQTGNNPAWGLISTQNGERVVVRGCTNVCLEALGSGRLMVRDSLIRLQQNALNDMGTEQTITNSVLVFGAAKMAINQSTIDQGLDLQSCTLIDKSGNEWLNGGPKFMPPVTAEDSILVWTNADDPKHTLTNCEHFFPDGRRLENYSATFEHTKGAEHRYNFNDYRSLTAGRQTSQVDIEYDYNESGDTRLKLSGDYWGSGSVVNKRRQLRIADYDGNGNEFVGDISGVDQMGSAPQYILFSSVDFGGGTVQSYTDVGIPDLLGLPVLVQTAPMRNQLLAIFSDDDSQMKINEPTSRYRNERAEWARYMGVGSVLYVEGRGVLEVTAKNGNILDVTWVTGPKPINNGGEQFDGSSQTYKNPRPRYKAYLMGPRGLNRSLTTGATDVTDEGEPDFYGSAGWESQAWVERFTLFGTARGDTVTVDVSRASFGGKAGAKLRGNPLDGEWVRSEAYPDVGAQKTMQEVDAQTKLLRDTDLTD